MKELSVREKTLKEANEYLDKVNEKADKILDIIKDLPKKEDKDDKK